MVKKISLIFIFVFLLILPFFLPRFYVYLTAIILLTGLLSTSLNLAIGYCGMYQFHHAIFYGLGAYGTALMITKTNLSPYIAFIIGPIVALFFSLIIGLICMRLTKLYFGMLQISLGSLIWAIVYRWYSFTGGDDGIHGIPVPDILANTKGGYYFTLIVVSLSIFILYKLVNSPFGKTIQGIRDNPVRTASIGINIDTHKLVVLMIAGFFGGVSGMLFVVVDNAVFPDMMFWTYSLEILIMTLLGGMYTFWGPFIGAVIIVSLRTYLSSITQYWPMILGIILIIVIIFLPQGIYGMFENIMKGNSNNARS